MKEIINCIILFSVISYIGFSELDSCHRNPAFNNSLTISNLINSGFSGIQRFCVETDKEIRSYFFN